MSATSDSDASNHDGFALAASFASWGAILWIAPAYLGFSGTVFWGCYVVGGFFVAISFLGALVELERFTGTEAFGWWGVGGFFLIFGVLFHLAAVTFTLTPIWLVTVKVAAMLLDMLGAPFVFYGIGSVLDESRPKSNTRRPKRTNKDAILTILSFVSASLPLLGAMWKALFGS